MYSYATAVITRWSDNNSRSTRRHRINAKRYCYFFMNVIDGGVFAIILVIKKQHLMKSLIFYDL